MISEIANMNILSLKPPLEFDVWNEIVIKNGDHAKKLYLNPRFYNRSYIWKEQFQKELTKVELTPPLLSSQLDSIQLFINDDLNNIFEIPNFPASSLNGSDMSFNILTSFYHLEHRLNVDRDTIKWIFNKLGFYYPNTNHENPLEINYHVYKGICQHTSPEKITRLISDRSSNDHMKEAREYLFFRKITSTAQNAGAKYVRKNNWNFLKSSIYHDDKNEKIWISEKLKSFVIKVDGKYLVVGYKDYYEPYKTTSFSDYLQLLVDQIEKGRDYEFRFVTNKEISYPEIEFYNEGKNISFFRVSFTSSKFEEIDMKGKEEWLNYLKKKNPRDNERFIMGKLRSGEGDMYGF